MFRPKKLNIWETSRCTGQRSFVFLAFAGFLYYYLVSSNALYNTVEACHSRSRFQPEGQEWSERLPFLESAFNEQERRSTLELW